MSYANRPLAVTSQLQLLSTMLEGKVKVWDTEMSTNVKRSTRKGLLPDYYSILAIICNIIHVFFSKTFFVLFCFPSNMAAKYAVRHVWRYAKVVYGEANNSGLWSFLGRHSQSLRTRGRLHYQGEIVTEALIERTWRSRKIGVKLELIFPCYTVHCFQLVHFSQPECSHIGIFSTGFSHFGSFLL